MWHIPAAPFLCHTTHKLFHHLSAGRRDDNPAAMADLLQWVGDWAKGAQETVSFLADTKSLFYAASTVTVFAAGLVPRIGPMRALFLGASPLYTRIEAVSQRTAQVTALQELLRNTRGHGFYCVVQGPKGVGKSLG